MDGTIALMKLWGNRNDQGDCLYDPVYRLHSVAYESEERPMVMYEVFGTLFGMCFCILGAFIWIVSLMIVLVGAMGVLRVVIDNVFETNSIEIAKRLKMRKYLERGKNVSE